MEHELQGPSLALWLLMGSQEHRTVKLAKVRACGCVGFFGVVVVVVFEEAIPPNCTSFRSYATREGSEPGFEGWDYVHQSGR